MFKKIKEKLNSIPEHYLDHVLWGVGLLLIAIAIWGERKHKLWACGAVIL